MNKNQMIRRHYKLFICGIIIILAIPFVLDLLCKIDSSRGLIWFFMHQLYYVPLGSWVGKPFFTPDSEVYYFVNWPGRILTAVFYVVVLVFSKFAYSLFYRR